MADYDGKIKIGVVIDDSTASKDLSKLASKTDDLADGFKDAEKASLSFGDVLKANILSDAIISGFSKLTDAITGFAAGSVTTAAELKAEASRFEQAFGQMEGTATSAISEIADETGILDTRLNSAATSIYSFARASGGTEAESMSLMEDALTAAADAAAYYDRSLDDTTEQLMSFLKGNYENDAALGLSATEATRNAAAMDQFGKEFNDLTEIQKQQTLLSMVTDAQALSGAMGQASRESDGLENVMGNLSEVGRQIQGNIGAPVLEAIIPAIQEITNSLMQWTENVDWTAFGNAVSGFITGIIDNGPTIISIIAGIAAGFVAWNVVTMIQGVVSAINAFKLANEGASIAQLALNAAMNANPIGIIVTAITALITIIGTLWVTNEDFRNAVVEIWENIKAAFVEAWEAIEAAWSVASAYFTAIWNAIKVTFAPVVEYLSGIFSDAWESVKQIFSGVIDFIAGVFTGDWERAWDGIKNIFTGIWNGIVSVLEGAVNLIIKGINWLISQLNKVSFTLPDWVPVIGGNSFGFNIPSISEISIPRLATGSVIPPNREFLAVLGDNKQETEVVSPLSTMKQAMLEAMRESGISDGTITVVVNLDGKEVARNSVKHINNMTRQVGRSVLLI